MGVSPGCRQVNVPECLEELKAAYDLGAPAYIEAAGMSK